MSTGSLTPPASHSLRSRISLASLGQFSRFARGILYFALTGSLPYPFFFRSQANLFLLPGPLVESDRPLSSADTNPDTDTNTNKD